MRLQQIAYYFNAGGPFMWAILIIGAMASAVIVERLIFYFVVCRKKGPALVAKTVGMLDSGNKDAAAANLKGSAPLTILLKTAYDRFSSGMSEQDIRDGVEEAAVREVPRLTLRLNYLSLSANISTLLGLLGTISGLMRAFRSLGAVEASKKASLLASGISEAMTTTAFGLAIAVLCMVTYTLLYNRQLRLTRELDEAVLRFINYLKKKIA